MPLNKDENYSELDRFKYKRELGQDPKIDEHDPVLHEIHHYRILNPFLFSSMQGMSVLNSLFSMQIHRVNDWDGSNFGDSVTEYRHNSYGFRGEEFPGQVDLITGGCSQTVGIGVPEEATWHESLAQRLGVSHVNIAAAGWSIPQLVESIMWYIKKYGKPKTIVLLVPDFARGFGVYNKNVLRDPKVGHMHETSGSPVYLSKYDVNAADTYPNISKRPHIPTDIFPPEFTVYFSARALASFIEYCRVGEIELVWGSWNNPIATIYEILDDIKAIAEDLDVRQEVREAALREVDNGLIDTDGFVDIDLSTWNDTHIKKLKMMSCHQDIKQKYSKWFDVGLDEQEHYGAHAHAHVADAFFDKLKNMGR